MPQSAFPFTKSANGAEFSTDRMFRYVLTRQWDESADTAAWIAGRFAAATRATWPYGRPVRGPHGWRPPAPGRYRSWPSSRATVLAFSRAVCIGVDLCLADQQRPLVDCHAQRRSAEKNVAVRRYDCRKTMRNNRESGARKTAPADQ